MPRPLPPHLSERQMARAFQRFAGVTGPEHVFQTPEDRDGYLDAFAPGNASAHAAGGGVAPGDVEQVQAIIRIAGEMRVPLWTVSAGRNLAYGGAAPVMPGCVVLDLRRLNRILEVDEDLAYCVVEPGVSFFDLNDHLKARGIKLWVSSPAPGWGSVLGNALERGFGSTAYGDHAANVCGLEVVLADGSLVRTGMWAMDGARTGALFKNGFGPGFDAIFMQSNLGVVTKMGLWLMPAPEAMASCEINFPRESDLAAAIDAVRPLRVRGVVNSSAAMRNVLGTAAGSTTRSDWYDGEGLVPESVMARMQAKLKVGYWNMNFGIYGAEEVVAAHVKIARQAFDQIPGAAFEAKLVSPEALARPDRGGTGSRGAIPSMSAFQILNWPGGAGAHVDFSPVFAPRGADAVAIYQLARRHIEAAGVDFIGTFYNFGRSMVLVCAIIFDTTDEDRTAAVRREFAALVEAAGRAGFGEYRTHIDFMDDVARQYGWNDHALMRMTHKIKDALDPEGVLSPGKSGIWPAWKR